MKIPSLVTSRLKKRSMNPNSRISIRRNHGAIRNLTGKQKRYSFLQALAKWFFIIAIDFSSSSSPSLFRISFISATCLRDSSEE